MKIPLNDLMHRRPSFREERSGIVEANVLYHALGRNARTNFFFAGCYNITSFIIHYVGWQVERSEPELLRTGLSGQPAEARAMLLSGA